MFTFHFGRIAYLTSICRATVASILLAKSRRERCYESDYRKSAKRKQWHLEKELSGSLRSLILEVPEIVAVTVFWPAAALDAATPEVEMDAMYVRGAFLHGIDAKFARRWN